MWNRTQQRRLVGLAAMAATVTSFTACGDSTKNAGSSATTTTNTAVATPTLSASAPRGASVNASYWTSQIDALDPKTKDFADTQAADFCKDPGLAVLKARMIQSGSYKVFEMDYFFQYNEDPTWTNDLGVQEAIAWYMISNYCPENSG